MEGTRARIRGGWLFLVLVAAAYAATALVEPAKARAALASFFEVLGPVAPILLVVLVLMILSERFFTARRVEHWLGPGAGARGWLLAVVAGAIATGPVYPWYALLADLRRKGMSPALVAVLLYARAVKLPLLPLMAHYFGPSFALVLSGWIIAFALVSGLVVPRSEDGAHGARAG